MIHRFTIAVLLGLATVITAQASSDPAQSRRQLLVKCIELHAAAAQAKSEERAQLLKKAPRIMKKILALPPSEVSEIREVANCAAIYWRSLITEANKKEVLPCLAQAAELAETMFSHPQVRGDDLRNATHLYHTIGINGDAKNLAYSEIIQETLLSSFEHDLMVHDFITAANTQINMAKAEPRKAKEHFVKAINLVIQARPYIDKAPLALLKMHASYVNQLAPQAREIASAIAAAKPLALKLAAHAAAVEQQIAELERPTPISFTPNPTPSPTASTEGPTPSPVDDWKVEEVTDADMEGIQ